MDELLGLWLPTVLSSVVVFIASFIAWTISPHHKPDWKRISNEDDFLEKVRSATIAPGQYIFPCCEDWSELKDPDKKARYEAGPHGILNLWPAAPNMPRNMFLTYLFFLVTGVFVGYITSLALDPGAAFVDVFQVAGTAGILAYCFAFMPNAIWFGKPLRAVVMDILDGLAYGLLTGIVFGWFWPSS